MPSQLGRAPRCQSFSKSRCSIILSISCKEDVPGVQSRECHPFVVYNAGGSSLLPSSLQMRNFSNSLLAETPLGELVENIDKYLICDWAERENEHWDVLMGAYLEIPLGISGISRSNKKGRFNCFLMFGDPSLRAAGSEVSRFREFTKILIQLLRSWVRWEHANKLN